MPIENMIFYIFSFLAIVSAGMVVISKNPVQAVLFLVLTFCATAGLWMLLEAEFLAVTLVLVYVGAVMVLFLFVVMMLDVELASIREGFARYLPLGLIAAATVVFGLIYAVNSKHFGLKFFSTPLPHSSDYSNITALGELLYTEFLYPFLLAGILLLIAIVAAISLTFRGKRGSRTQNVNWQVTVQKEDRIRLVKMNLE